MEIRFFEPGNPKNQAIQDVTDWTGEEVKNLIANQQTLAGRADFEYIHSAGVRVMYRMNGPHRKMDLRPEEDMPWLLWQNCESKDEAEWLIKILEGGTHLFEFKIEE